MSDRKENNPTPNAAVNQADGEITDDELEGVVGGTDNCKPTGPADPIVIGLNDDDDLGATFV